MRGIDLIWLLLMALTVLNSLIAEQAEPSLFFVIVIALSVAWKGHMVVDRFMELKNANQKIRGWMRAYFLVIPGIMVVVYALPEWIAEFTRLS